VDPGKRRVSIAVFALWGALATLQAGHVFEDGTEAMYLAPDLTAHASYAPRCGEPRRFEQLDSAGGGRLIHFEWRPRTSELSFDIGTADSGVALPERFMTAASLASSRGRCE
jgi:hypothetical protein